MKHRDQKRLAKEKVYLAYASFLLFITEGSQNMDLGRAGIWKQKLVQRPWRDAAYELAPCGLLSLLYYRIHDRQPGVAPPFNHYLRKWPTGLSVYRLIFWRYFLSWEIVGKWGDRSFSLQVRERLCSASFLSGVSLLQGVMHWQWALQITLASTGSYVIYIHHPFLSFEVALST